MSGYGSDNKKIGNKFFYVLGFSVVAYIVYLLYIDNYDKQLSDIENNISQDVKIVQPDDVEKIVNDIWQYKSKSGNLIFTSDYDSIPLELRDKAVKVNR